jgi:hypothetical protein
LLSTLRKLADAKWADSDVDGVITLPLGYAIGEMVDAGEELAAHIR